MCGEIVGAEYTVCALIGHARLYVGKFKGNTCGGRNAEHIVEYGASFLGKIGIRKIEEAYRNISVFKESCDNGVFLGTVFPIAIESKRSDYSEKVTAELNQSFISPDGINWYDIAQNTTVSKFYKDLNRIKLVETNVCLKAYTAYLEDLELNLSSNSTSFI